MKNKKVIIGIIIGVVLCLIVCVLFIFFGGKTYKKTVFIGDNAKVKVDGNDLLISYADIKIKKQKVFIYDNNSISEGYVITGNESTSDFNNVLRAYDGANEAYNFNTELVAYTKDLNIDFINIITEYYDEVSDIQPYLNKMNIDLSIVTDIYDFSITSLDLEGDGKTEYIYTFGLIKDEVELDCLMIMEKDGKYYLVKEMVLDYDDDDEDNYIPLELISIMDFNHDDKFEFVVKNIEYDSKIFYDVFNFDGSKFNKVTLNEIN